jgi:LDH2 family malate/lactate/ureidoglycolate dehydrogenase
MMLQAALGTNALSVSASAKGGDGFDLDMATSAVTYGQVKNLT